MVVVKLGANQPLSKHIFQNEILKAVSLFISTTAHRFSCDPAVEFVRKFPWAVLNGLLKAKRCNPIIIQLGNDSVSGKKKSVDIRF